MDRKISDEEKSRMRRRQWLRAGVVAAVVAAAAATAVSFLGKTVDSNKLEIAEARRGSLESTVIASGKVVPAYEEIISSPIATRIVEVYCKAGDSVDAGTPLLRLDLQSAESEISRLRDSRQKQVLAVEQQKLNNATRLTQIEMEIKVKQMSVSQLKVEVANERRLDSIGSGTGDRVRQAELSYRTACIELEQLRSQLENERRALSASLSNQKLDLSIADRSLAEQLRTVEDARLKAPRSATLTYINNNIGSTVSPGERIAVLADLTDFKIDAEIAESNARYLTAGGKAAIKINDSIFSGTVMNVAPLSNGGAVTFSVIPADERARRSMRPGLSVNVYVVRESKSDVVLIPMGRYYTNGPGGYDMYVEETDGTLVRRKVELGGANYDWVEVVSGIAPGERVAVMEPALTGKRYKIKNRK